MFYLSTTDTYSVPKEQVQHHSERESDTVGHPD